MSARIAIIDDEASVRESMAAVLATYGYETSLYRSARSFLAAADRGSASCIIMDVRMPVMDGFQAFTALRAEGISAPVIFVTGHGDIKLAVKCLKAGAADFIEKPVNDEALAESICLAVQVAGRRESRDAGRATFLARFSRLTERERTIAGLLSMGHTSSSIAALLSISGRTVDHHRAKILEKMETPNLTQLVKVMALNDDAAAVVRLHPPQGMGGK